MAEEDKDDKQFDPSEQRLRKAREKGDIPTSTEVNSALMFVGVFLSLIMAGSVMVPAWLTAARRAIGEDLTSRAAAQLSGLSAVMVLGFATVPAVMVLLGLIVQRGIVFAPDKLKPDIKRINPFKNAKQKFGKSGIVAFLISLLKAGLVGLGGYLLYRNLVAALVNASYGTGWQWTAGLGMMIKQVLMLAVGISAMLAIIDFLWKRREFMTRNKMSMKEMRDEHKENEGDPHLKQARRQKAVDIVMSSMLADVQKADVVIVNPTHYAVALEWKRGSGKAPVCLAKGVDEVAARIRERAKEYNVPIWSDPPCARAIHATVEIGDEIKREHFGPVAAAIRFAQEMRTKAKKGW